MPENTSVYIHVPFCRRRCAYCDFNTYAGLGGFIPAYVQAVCKEIRTVAERAGERLPVHTIFFGGGTPSLLPVASIESILTACWVNFDVAPEVEITLEANPGTVTLDWLQQIRALGVNRMSYGMQSASMADLRILGREHDPVDVIRAVEWSRLAGFDNLNLDLIYGIPGQDLRRWADSLEFALRLKPEHLSLYCLTVEAGTPFRRWIDRGVLDEPEDDLAAEMYELTCQRQEQEGFAHYEISNWARRDSTRDYSCLHNLQYWRMKPYLGFGAGAHGFAHSLRTANVRGVQTYIRRCGESDQRPFPASPATEILTPIDRWTEMQETMMVGLRLLEQGVAGEDFQRRFGIGLQDAFGAQIARLTQMGLVEWSAEQSERLRLSQRGWLLGNRVFMEFIDVPRPAGLV